MRSRADHGYRSTISCNLINLERNVILMRMSPIILLVLIALSTTAGAQDRPAQLGIEIELEAELRSLITGFNNQRAAGSMFPKPAEVTAFSELSSGLFDRYRIRRREVLALWIQGKRVHHIAAETGYTVPNVIETINNYETAVENHLEPIKTLVFTDPLANADEADENE